MSSDLKNNQRPSSLVRGLISALHQNFRAKKTTKGVLDPISLLWYKLCSLVIFIIFLDVYY